MARKGDLIIRSYQPSDERAVIELWHECGLVVPQNDPKKDIEKKVEFQPQWFLVGTVDGKVIATAMVGYDGHRGWINYLGVSPHFRRRGFGQRMMKKAEIVLKEVGCQKINVQIRKTNESAIFFYESCGYSDDEVFSMGKRLDK